MAAGNVISGKDGTIKTGSSPAVVHHILNWKAKEEVETDRFGSNSSSGAKLSVPGTVMWDGSFEGKLHDGEPCPIRARDQVQAQFHFDGTSGNYLAGVVTIKSIEFEVDIDTGKALSYSVTWEGHGDLIDTGSLLSGS